jgi:hypothetical protein
MTKVPTTLTSYIFWKSSSVAASNLPSQKMAALFTSTSMRGRRATRAATAARSVIDSAWCSTARSSRARAAALAVSVSSFTSTITT